MVSSVWEFIWKSGCCLNRSETMSTNSHVFSTIHRNSLSYNIYFHSFIHSFIQQTLTGTGLYDYFKWKGYKYKPYHYLPEGQCLHILHFCLSPHCWQPQNIQVYFTYLFPCHLWQIFNLLLNDIYGFELACFRVPHMHWGPSMHWQYVCMLIKVPLGNEIACETHFLFSSKLHNILPDSILWIDF